MKLCRCLAALVIATTWFAAPLGLASPSHSSERHIAANPQLQTLDRTLNALYVQALDSVSDPQALRSEQRRWIGEVRNRCGDPQCLLAQYESRNRQLAALTKPGGRTACPVTETALIGNWMRVQDGDFEQFVLSHDKHGQAFASWLDHRPEMMGTWTFKDCTLHVTDPHNAALSFDYRIKAFANSVLHLQEVNTGDDSRYKRIAPRSAR